MSSRTVSIILTIVVIVLLWLLYAAWQKQKQKNEHYELIIAEQKDSIHHSRTETGRERAEKLAAIASAKQFQEAYPKFAERVAREFDVKLKDMKVFIENKFTAHGSGEGDVVTNIYGPNGYVRKEAAFGDRYLKAKLAFVDSTRFLYTYSYSDTISTVVDSKKKWFLGKERLYATSILQNKNASVTGSTSVLIDTYRDKRFVVYVGIGYDPLNNRPVVSGGIGYALFKF
jgi:hypothetical protein